MEYKEMLIQAGFVPSEQPDPYSQSELYRFWLGFAGDEDEAEKLAGFAAVNTETAAKMIEGFRQRASAKHAREADRQRLENVPKPVPQEPRKPQPRPREADPSREELERIPPSSLLASLVNDKYGFSEVIASASTSRKVLVLERFGESTYRLKRVYYQFYPSRADAITAIRRAADRMHLIYFGSAEKEPQDAL